MKVRLEREWFGHPGEVTLEVHALPPARGGDLDVAIGHVEQALATTSESARYRAEILDFVRAHPDALHRSCAEGHLTGSALVVNQAKDRTLLMLHAKLGMWLQPGGHADGDGNLASVAFNEATEETGLHGLRVVTPAIDADVHMIPARPGEPEHLHLDLRYLMFAPDDAVPAGNHESHALRWVGLEELQELATDASLRRLARIGLELAHSIDAG